MDLLDITQCKCYLKIAFLHAWLFLCIDKGRNTSFMLFRLGKHYWSEFGYKDYYVSVAHLFFSDIAFGRVDIFKWSEFWIQSSDWMWVSIIVILLKFSYSLFRSTFSSLYMRGPLSSPCFTGAELMDFWHWEITSQKYVEWSRNF